MGVADGTKKAEAVQAMKKIAGPVGNGGGDKKRFFPKFKLPESKDKKIKDFGVAHIESLVAQTVDQFEAYVNTLVDPLKTEVKTILTAEKKTQLDNEFKNTVADANKKDEAVKAMQKVAKTPPPLETRRKRQAPPAVL